MFMDLDPAVFSQCGSGSNCFVIFLNFVTCFLIMSLLLYTTPPPPPSIQTKGFLLPFSVYETYFEEFQANFSTVI